MQAWAAEGCRGSQGIVVYVFLSDHSWESRGNTARHRVTLQRPLTPLTVNTAYGTGVPAAARALIQSHAAIAPVRKLSEHELCLPLPAVQRHAGPRAAAHHHHRVLGPHVHRSFCPQLPHFLSY